MAKVKMFCPISKTLCIECAIYRGRHYYLCFSKSFQGSMLDPERMEEKRSQQRETFDEKFGMPDNLPRSSKWIHNVEELIERRGL